MLRSSRHVIRRLRRPYNFRNEDVKLPGMKDDIALPEELRKIERALLTGEKESPELLKAINSINNPYNELNLPPTSTQKQIKETISLRRRQYAAQIEDSMKMLPSAGAEASIVVSNDQIKKLEESLVKLDDIETLLGTIQARKRFDNAYAIEVHQIIWSDLSKGEKVRHYLTTAKLKTALKLKDNLPPALVNSMEDRLVTSKQQQLVLKGRFSSKSARMTFWQFGYLFLFACYYICRLDEMRYEDKCWHQACYVFGDNPPGLERLKRHFYFILLCWHQGFWEHLVYRYFIRKYNTDSAVDSFNTVLEEKEELEELSISFTANVEMLKSKKYFLN